MGNIDRARLNELLGKFKADDMTDSEIEELKAYCEAARGEARADGDDLGVVLNMMMLAFIAGRLAQTRKPRRWYERLFRL